HGAGGNCESPPLIALSGVLAGTSIAAPRCELTYRARRPSGAALPSGAASGRPGLARAAGSLGGAGGGRADPGSASCGGRQASILAAERPAVAAGWLMLSYPLHPPGKPESLRTDHFGGSQAPVLFAHGSKDVFGSEEEMRAAMKLLKGPVELELFAGAT